jgi:hypothetical protein
MNIFLYFKLFILCLLLLEVESSQQKRCKLSFDIRSRPHSGYASTKSGLSWDALTNCTVLDGHFSISIIQGTQNYTNKDFHVFPNLEEITGYLLVFNANGLTNLGHIFPNLRIIGGKSLIKKYALIVYQNDDLQKIGLEKLEKIENGGIAILDNPSMCSHEYFDWMNKTANKMITENGENCFAPKLTKYESNRTDKIELEWKPPLYGKVSHYLVGWKAQDLFVVQDNPCNTTNLDQYDSETKDHVIQLEDAVLNAIYPVASNWENDDDEDNDDSMPKTRKAREPSDEKPEITYTKSSNSGSIKISSTKYSITGLQKYTQYYIQVFACENENSCSKIGSTPKVVTTAPIR